MPNPSSWHANWNVSQIHLFYISSVKDSKMLRKGWAIQQRNRSVDQIQRRPIRFLHSRWSQLVTGQHLPSLCGATLDEHLTSRNAPPCPEPVWSREKPSLSFFALLIMWNETDRQTRREFTSPQEGKSFFTVRHKTAIEDTVIIRRT